MAVVELPGISNIGKCVKFDDKGDLEITGALMVGGHLMTATDLIPSLENYGQISTLLNYALSETLRVTLSGYVQISTITCSVSSPTLSTRLSNYVLLSISARVLSNYAWSSAFLNYVQTLSICVQTSFWLMMPCLLPFIKKF
jgi:hypothetical protein